MVIFVKGMVGGVLAATLMWIFIVGYSTWQATRNVRELGYAGPVAVAGGWQYLAQLPWVVALLSVAFGLGFYGVVWWVVRHS